MGRFFNTAGPNRPEWHYTLPALLRLPTVRNLVNDRSWFVLHAPRQSGKTTAMLALAAELTASGAYAALWASCEGGEPYGAAPEKATSAVINAIRRSADHYLPPALRPPAPGDASADALAGFLNAWCEACPRPVVLLLDEIDALRDDALISVLRQLRSVYTLRPTAAPSTVALIGLRDVRDYKVASGGSSELGTASPFNVKVDSVTLRNFTEADIAALFAQHTAETGQAFTPAALARVSALTGGQPWLVNALGWQLQRKLCVEGTIDASHVELAKERLILSRATHLDSLADKLNDPRVRSVIAPILSGDDLPFELPERDIDWCEDLGLVRRSSAGLEIANPIYREVLPRELTSPAQLRIRPPDRSWALPDGRLDLRGLLEAFVSFWREHGEWMVRGQTWPESAQQLVLMAFLQRLVNGGGWIDREYGLGQQRLDLLIRWFTTTDPLGKPLSEDRHALELKVWRDGRPDPLVKGLAQIDGYLARLGLPTGTLVLFDARTASPHGDAWERRGEFSEAVTPGGRTVTVLRV